MTVTATDSAGNASSRSGTVFVTAAPGGNANSRPTLMKVRQSHAVFRVGTKPTAIAAANKRPPIGTTFRFSLDRAATVTITISRSEPGRRSGKRCVKPTGKLAHNKRCTRSVRAGVLTRHAKQASNSVAFSGRVGRRALKPGSYVATFVATAGEQLQLAEDPAVQDCPLTAISPPSRRGAGDLGAKDAPPRTPNAARSPRQMPNPSVHHAGRSRVLPCCTSTVGPEGRLGPAAIGYLLQDEEGVRIAEHAEAIGTSQRGRGGVPGAARRPHPRTRARPGARDRTLGLTASDRPRQTASGISAVPA